MIGILVLAATLTVAAVTLTALGYWWGYGNGQADGYLACELDNDIEF
jgi:nitrogen fixation-related uncharacterized protein